MSLWHWIIVLGQLAAIAVFAISIGRILDRLGYNRWLAVLAFIPLVNLVAIWKLSKASWPKIGGAGK